MLPGRMTAQATLEMLEDLRISSIGLRLGCYGRRRGDLAFDDDERARERDGLRRPATT